MNKKIVLSTLAFAIIAPASMAFAEETQPVITTQETGRRQDMRVQREDGRQLIKDQREQNKGEIDGLRQQKRLEFQDKKEKMEQTQCKNIETKIASRVGRYENNGKMLDKVYGNMQARLTRLVARLDAAGANTSQLKTDIVKLNELITTLRTDQATFMATLKESQAFACGNSEGEFKGKMEQARKVPEIIKADRAAIKNFFQTTIKADLQAIRKTLADQKEATEPAETTKTTETPAVAPVVTPAPTTTPAPTPAVPTL